MVCDRSDRVRIIFLFTTNSPSILSFCQYEAGITHPFLKYVFWEGTWQVILVSYKKAYYINFLANARTV